MSSSVFTLLFFLILTCLFSVPAFADTIDLSVTYGYQNIAKAGRYLPLSITIENTDSKTFSGLIHVYMVESKNSVYEYQYQKTVEGESSDVLPVTVSLSAGINQILVTAEDRDGIVQGTKRIGLDVAGSDAELIIGLLSANADALSYMNDISMRDGILRTRTVALDPEKLPSDETALDQLDILCISDYTMSDMKENEAEVIRRWIDRGGVLMLGTGALGQKAVEPYFSSYLREELVPRLATLDPSLFDEGNESNTSNEALKLMAASLSVQDGQELFVEDGEPLLSAVAVGAGRIVFSGFDFCDIERYATENTDYVDQLFTAVLGEGRLEQLSVSASEKSLKQYWDIQEVMNMTDLRKIPRPELYLLVLLVYVLLIGPVLYSYLRAHELLRMYRSMVILTAVFCTVIVYMMSMSTRFSGTFVNYVRRLDISEQSVDETDFINVRSPYRETYGIPVRTEYYVYPVLKGSDYTGDIQNLLSEGQDYAHTTIDNGREKTSITVENTEPFTARYFELDNKMPNTIGSFDSDFRESEGQLKGTLTNNTGYTLSDAALILYGRIIRLDRLENGQTVDIAGIAQEMVPIGDADKIAMRVTQGSGRKFLRYYLQNELAGYFSGARLVGFLREDTADFTTDTAIEQYGITMAVASLPVSGPSDGVTIRNALSTDPTIVSGGFDIETNTIASMSPTVLAYHFGETNVVDAISIESLSEDALNNADSIRQVLPFRGSLSFLNQKTGGFDVIDVGDGQFDSTALSDYLSNQNTLTVRYAPEDNRGSISTRLYLPVMTVTSHTA